jgi:endothelin-converting enzyme/putative endopeptidase
MDDTTRGRAKEKMAAIANKIGYPDSWRDYSKVATKPGDYFGNALAARRFEVQREIAKVGKPTDRKEWGMTPPTVNAYYNPLNNEMAFPAGILQAPFFHRDFPAPMNFGGVGMVMGHELTHGFDDSGRKFDAKGRLVTWWDESVTAQFEARAQCVDDLYDGYEVLPGVKLNGKLTLGENIADLGGLKQAFRAWRAWAAKHGAPEPIVEGLTNDQLFFVAFAQTWCSTSTPENDRLRANVDSHSHARYRVIGPASSFEQFAETFQCAESTPMNPATRCGVW